MESIEPVVVAVEVPVNPERAFDAFCREFSRWWPLASHSLARDRAASCSFEPSFGGRIFETDVAGSQQDWGRVIAFESPRRCRFSWHPGRPVTIGQWVEVTFDPEAGGSRVTLTHGGWERLGPEVGPMLRNEYVGGWQRVLGASYVPYVSPRH